MVAQTAQAARDTARRYTRCSVGMCLMYVRTWLDIDSRDSSAATAWDNAKHKHRGDRHPPAGAPMFWLGGSKGYGHITLSMSSSHMRGTDMPSAGRVTTQLHGWVDQYWGASQHYVGWTEDLNGVVIPYLGNPGSQFDEGDVYLSKLHRRQRNSDSVSRLVWRLRNHSEIPNSHRPPKMTDTYHLQVEQAVRYYQRNVIPKEHGPDDGSELSTAQARRLFGDNYRLVR